MLRLEIQRWNHVILTDEALREFPALLRHGTRKRLHYDYDWVILFFDVAIVRSGDMIMSLTSTERTRSFSGFLQFSIIHPLPVRRIPHVISGSGTIIREL